MYIYNTVLNETGKSEINGSCDQLDKSTSQLIESMVQQLLMKQRAKSLKPLANSTSNNDDFVNQNVDSNGKYASIASLPKQMQIIAGVSTTNSSRNKTTNSTKRDASTTCSMITTATLKAAEEDHSRRQQKQQRQIDLNGNLSVTIKSSPPSSSSANSSPSVTSNPIAVQQQLNPSSAQSGT